MSESDPAWPAGWPVRPDALWYAGVALVLLGGCAVSGWGVKHAVDGALGLAFLFGLVGLLNLALVADSVVTVEFRRSQQGGGIQLGYIDELTQWATVLPYRWSAEIAVRFFWLLGLASFGPLALVALRAGEVLVFAGAFLVFLLSGVALARTFRGPGWRSHAWRGRLALTSEGVYHRWWLYSVFLPWQHISGIRAGVRSPYAPRFRRRRPPKPGPMIEFEVDPGTGTGTEQDAPKQQTAGHVLNGTWLWWPLSPNLGRRLTAGGGNRRLTVSALAADSVLVYRSLRFYHQHPELRWELGTHVAAERFHNGELYESSENNGPS